MRFRALAALPVAWVAAFLLGVAVVPASASIAYVRAEIEAAKLLTLAGCVIAARAFSPGDYLRRAWGLLATCFALLLARDLIYFGVLRGGVVSGPHFEYLQAAIVTAANLIGLVGNFMIARAWYVAGIELPGRPLQRAAVMALWVVVSSAITGNTALADARLVAAGEVGALVGLASDLSDLLSMWIVTPVLFTALALRGGLLRWPWAMLTASLLFWLFYDAGPMLIGLLGLSVDQGRVLRESFRGAACLYGFSAGVAQALALRAGPRARR